MEKQKDILEIIIKDKPYNQPMAHIYVRMAKAAQESQLGLL